MNARWKRVCGLCVVVMSALAWGVSRAGAADVVWVYQQRGGGGGTAPGAGGGGLEWEDDQWRALLEGAGHTIVAHDWFDDLDADASAVDLLNSADLVIVSRDTASGDYNTNTEEAAIWTEGITAPMLLLTSFPIRNNRWNMVDTDQNPLAMDPLVAVDPAHPVFAGVTLDAAKEVQVWDDSLLGPDDNINITDGDVGNGTLIAEESGTGNPWIIYWEDGVEFYDGSNTFAGGPRMFFGAGSDDDPNTWGEKNLTAAGDQIFLNAVNFLTGGAMAPQLQAGDANRDFKFDQLDLVQVQVAAKYLTGQAATWGEGDWDGAPGGSQGSPPPGNGFFDQLDIIAALGAGKYLTGPYAAIGGAGQANDGQTSIKYDAKTGEVAVDAPAGKNLTSVNIESAASIFKGEPAANLGGSFDNDTDSNIFKATFGGSFGSISFGNVAQAGLSADYVMNDLTVVGSLAGGGDLGNVDLIYVPEPGTMLLAVLALVGGAEPLCDGRVREQGAE